MRQAIHLKKTCLFLMMKVNLMSAKIPILQGQMKQISETPGRLWLKNLIS